MQAISTALNQLLETGVWFLRARELRLWVVRVSGDMRKPALQLAAGLEFFPHNRGSAFLVLPDAHTPADPGWQVRANRLLAHWPDRRKAFLERENIAMPEAVIDGLRPANSPAIAPLRNACLAVSNALRPPLDGCVAVLAPAVVTDVNVMGVELEALVNDPALAAWRWIWMLDTEVPWPDILDRLGERALRCECSPDPQQQKKDLQAMLSAPAAMIGRAGPRAVTPPRRVGKRPPLPPEKRAAILREAGISPEYCDQAPELQRLILAAAVAMNGGERVEAVRLQQQAADLAFSLKLFDVTVLCRIALGTYLTVAGRRDEALHVMRNAAQLAKEHHFPLQEAQAHLGVGVLLALAERYAESAEAYSVCARCAETAGIPVLAIEAWRMAGQVALQGRAEQKAFASFREAIRVAEGSDVEAVQDSTAAEAARKLADLCELLDLPQQAHSLRTQAEAMENGEVGIKDSVLVEA